MYMSHRYHTSISYTVDIGPWNNGGFPPKSYMDETLANYATTSLAGLCGLYRAIYSEPRSWPPPYSSFDDWRSWVGLIRDTTSCYENVVYTCVLVAETPIVAVDVHVRLILR